MGQGAEVAEYASTYVLYVLPFAYFSILARLNVEFSSSQEVASLGMESMFAGSLIYIGLLAVLFFWLDMRLRGVALYTGLLYLCQYILLKCSSERASI